MHKKGEEMTSKGKARSSECAEASSGAKLFQDLVDIYRQTNPSVERVKLFGFDCLRTAGKVFAKLHNGQLVMKLPAARITALMMAGHLRPYERGRTEMKEWAVVATTQRKLVFALSEESRSFVGG